MRRVSTFALAALLIATTVCATESQKMAQLQDAMPQAHKAAMQAANKVANHLGQMTRNRVAAAAMAGVQAMAEARRFGAMDAAATPAPTCDQEGYSAAQVVVLQACPSLSGLISGTVALTDFLPGFCGSNCYKVIAANLPKYGVCLDASTKPLVSFVDGCLQHPECYGETALKSGLTLTATCGSGATALFAFSNSTTAAKNDISNFCSACLTVEQAYIQAYPRCVAANSAAAAGLSSALTAMCSRTSGTTGDYCAWNLRTIGKIDCSTTASCTASDWCDNRCNLVLTSAKLDTMCQNPCLSNLATVAPAIGADKVLIQSLGNLFCSTVPNSTSYCYLSAQASLAVYNPTSQSAMTTTCAGNTGLCLANYLTMASALSSASARSDFATCAATLSSATNLYYYCQSEFESGLRDAEMLRATAALICSTNTAGSYCATTATTLGYSSCFQYASAGSCSSSCATTLAGYMTAAGCCLGPVNDYLRSSSTYYYASYLPTGTFTVTLAGGVVAAYKFSSQYSVANPDRSMQPMNALAYCSNTSALWSDVEDDCPASDIAVSRSFSVRLSYAAVTADAATANRVLNGLIADAAANAEVPQSSIKNATITQDTSISIASSRRASSSGVKFAFVIDGASASTIATAASTFDASAKSGLDTSNTGNAASNGCANCVASGQDASALASSSSGGGSSSASTTTVAVAAVAALAALLL